jgi:hypothetical protein
MKLKPKKEELLKKLYDVNNEYYYKVMDGEAVHDSIGNDFKHLHRALGYVPNKVIKEWTKEMKKEIKI